ncbi:MAG: WYL domain-containing protein [Planctomycetes bacterium]|nr:WYL domain-containing protein [Planctomycetota bacterium]
MTPGSAQLLRQWLLLERFCAASVWKSIAALARSLGICHETGDVNVTIRFSSEVARYVEESRWHSSQQCEYQPDGSLLVRLDLSGTTELKSWVLGFGQHAEVLKPVSLRAEIQAELQATLEFYEGSGVRVTQRPSPHYRKAR